MGEKVKLLELCSLHQMSMYIMYICKLVVALSQIYIYTYIFTYVYKIVGASLHPKVCMCIHVYIPPHTQTCRPSLTQGEKSCLPLLPMPWLLLQTPRACQSWSLKKPEEDLELCSQPPSLISSWQPSSLITLPSSYGSQFPSVHFLFVPLSSRFLH